ncbi:hypothetical protein TSTA_039290 [Talaromyces stipitatus ATCC 10500]|uniref:Uncharacterized protein n=1 Tax=Talaromyces stipitatus (strain ATCC 10500 / CBS 375.48 / QM 6759 / NRRL 1006) TaxID=441959 RepID=B8M3Y5_TALSN|nr:uncharacterized protein TSTA_039290 [Talaromyces stipitatus ATCC 10500]EED20728.1 hypothetical protein TSTA_039290 [Talaromyces stipitatus ATCC 10500]
MAFDSLQDASFFFFIETNPIFPPVNMFSHTNLLSVTCAMAVFVPPLLAWEIQVEHRGLNLTLVHGVVNANSDLSKRSSIPPECQFGDARSDWTYIQITGLSEGTACFGYSNFPLCGPGTWSDPDWTDIQIAMAKQTTLDGQFEGSHSGAWDGSFFLGTSAFSDRDTSLFDLALAESKARAINYYWSRDSDFAQVLGHNAACP